jgi:hypothetical protein
MVKCPNCGKKHNDGVATVEVKCCSRDRVLLDFDKPKLVGLRFICSCGRSWKCKESTVNAEVSR